MTSTSTPPRDLTDPVQNQAVLDLATVLGRGGAAGPDHGPAVVAEARSLARSRRLLAGLTEPVHLSVVWAMYGETGRMVPRDEHPHGEDFVRTKVRQLDWLTAGLPVTWSIVACDDGCPDQPSSGRLMARIAADEGYPTGGHRGVRVLDLADLIGGTVPIGPAFDRMTGTDQSRKGGSIVAALHTALRTPVPATPAGTPARHVVCYTDADLSANLAQLGALAARIVAERDVVAALGQRYGVDGAVLVRSDGPSTEPRSTGDKPDKVIILFRHFVRALLLPGLAHIVDTQAGFKAFDADALRPVPARMTSFDETFDVELLLRLARRYGPRSLAAEPIVFVEDFAATNFPSVDPGERHLAMVRQLVDVYDRLVAATEPAGGEAADLLDLLRGLDLDGYVRLIGRLRADDANDRTVFGRRWPVRHLRDAAAGR
jgi:hypothetical protein